MMTQRKNNKAGSGLGSRLSICMAAALILFIFTGCNFISGHKIREEPDKSDGAAQNAEKEGEKKTPNKLSVKDGKTVRSKEDKTDRGDKTAKDDKTKKDGITFEEGKQDEKENAHENKTGMDIDGIIAGMSLEDKIDQLFFICPEVITGVDAVTQAGEVTKAALEKYPVGGIVLFSKNIVDEGQLGALTENMSSYSRYPLFIAVDEEGGPLVARVANSGTVPVKKFPDMRKIGDTSEPSRAYEVGTTIGEYLKKYGFNVDFAPVADIDSNSENSVMGGRSFADNADVVSVMVRKVVEGLQSRGVSATLKHFPGHGDTDADSHDGAAVLNKSFEELCKMEFVPFKAGIEAGADMVMVGHISVPQVTGDNIPSSLSEKMITGCLRNKLGFQGIVLTDSMQMGAVTQFYSSGEAAVRFIKAGGDMILMPADFFGARQALLDAVDSGEISQERIDESLRRIYKIKMTVC